MITHKQCSKCGEIKSISEFSKRKCGLYGLRADCKQCQSKITAKWYQDNKEITKERAKKWKKENIDRYKESLRDQYQRHKDRNKAIYKQWMINNPEKVKEMYRKRNTKYRGTLKGRLTDRLSCAIRNSLYVGQKNKHHWEDLVGYTVEQLKKHLEKQFKDGMTWDNYGKWHIDHKIPISAFNFQTPEDIDFKRCWDLSNLQPMWARENLIKNNKLSKPFQPSLAIAA